MKTFKYLLLLILFLDFLIKWLPVNNTIYLVLRQLPDLLIIGLVLHHLIGGTSFNQSKTVKTFWILVLLFLIWSLIVSAIHIGRTDIVFDLLNVKAILRYTLLVVLVACYKPSVSEIDDFIKFCVAMICLQISLAVLQFLIGLPMRNFLAAKHLLSEYGAEFHEGSLNSFKNVNHFIGSMGDSISFAYYMVFGTCLLIATTTKRYFKLLIAVIVLSIMLYGSGSRGALLMLPLLIGWRISTDYGKLRLSKALVVISVVFFPAAYLLYYMVQVLGVGENNLSFMFVFSEDYVSAAMNQRLGVILLLIPELLADPLSLIGFGPDKYSFATYVDQNYGSLHRILVTILPNILEDIYWAALFVYFGPVGLFLWSLIVFHVLKSALKLIETRRSTTHIAIGRTTTALSICMITLGFLNPVFELRVISFHYWLFAGLTFYLSGPGNVQRVVQKHVKRPSVLIRRANGRKS